MRLRPCGRPLAPGPPGPERERQGMCGSGGTHGWTPNPGRRTRRSKRPQELLGFLPALAARAAPTDPDHPAEGISATQPWPWPANALVARLGLAQSPEGVTRPLQVSWTHWSPREPTAGLSSLRVQAQGQHGAGPPIASSHRACPCRSAAPGRLATRGRLAGVSRQLTLGVTWRDPSETKVTPKRSPEQTRLTLD